MRLCRISYPLRFYLPGVDDQLFWITHSGKKVGIQCCKGEGTRALSFSGTDFTFVKSLQVGSDATLTSGWKEPIRSFGITFTTNPPFFTGGICEPKKYTILICTFEVDDIPTGQVGKTSLHEFCFGAMARFVDLYRMAGNGPGITPLRTRDALVSVLAFSEGIYDFDDKIDGKFGSFDVAVHFNAAEFAPDDASKVVPELVKLLDHGFELEPHQEPLLDARDHAYVYRHYELAIVLAETAFEVFLQTKLRKAFSARKITHIRKRKKRKHVDVEVAMQLTKANVQADLLPLVDTILGQKHSKAMPEYAAWRDDAYEARNAIVHQGKRGYAEADAQKAGMAVAKFIDAIDKLIPT